MTATARPKETPEAPDFHVWLAERVRLDGRPLALPLALCACGCGETVADSRRQYIDGHAPSRRDGEERSCPRCGRKRWVQHARLAEFRGCVSCRHSWTAWNALQQRIVERMASDRMSLRALAKQSGAKYPALQKWFNVKRRVVQESNLRELAKFFGIPYEQALEEAGGITAEDVWRERARQLPPPPPAGSPERQARDAKAGLTRRGMKKSPEHWAKIRASKKASGADERFRAASTAAAKSQTGRAIRSLTGRLRGNPTPTVAELKKWAKEKPRGEPIGLSVEALVLIWREWLQRKGIGEKGNLDHLRVCPLRVEGRSWPEIQRALPEQFATHQSARTAHWQWHDRAGTSQCRKGSHEAL